MYSPEAAVCSTRPMMSSPFLPAVGGPIVGTPSAVAVALATDALANTDAFACARTMPLRNNATSLLVPLALSYNATPAQN